jgi:hypothetical protein
VEADDSQSRCDCIGVQPAEAELIGGCEENDDGSGGRGVREGERKLDGRMQGLTCLSASGQVSASNDKQPTWRRVLAMRHISIVA